MINNISIFLLKNSISVLVLLVILISPSCVKIDDDEPIQVSSNEIKPNGNDLIAEEVIGAFEVKNSRIRFLIDSDDDNYLFAGQWESKDVIGKMDKSGNLVWKVEISFICNSLKLFPDGEHAMAVGALDSDADNSFDKGGLLVVNSNGDIIQEMEVALTDDEVWFNGLDIWTKDDKINLVFAGAVKRNEVFFPYLKKLIVDDINTPFVPADFDENTVFEDKSGAIMLNVKYALEGTSDNFYYTMNYFNSDGLPFNMEVGKLVNTFDNEDWRTDLVSSDGTKVFGEPRDNIVISGGRIYVFASQEDASLGAGINFLSGVLTSFDKNNGTLEWGNKLDFSEFSDRIDDMQIIDNEIYISGSFASFNTNGRTFGYGFLAKAPLSTGVVDSFRSFGSDLVSSTFGSLRIEGDQILGAGSTNLSSGTTFDYWLVRIDKNDL